MQMAFSSDGKRLAAAPYIFENWDTQTDTITTERLVKIWDLTTGHELLTLGGENRN
jgi:WD40 repeat protein